MKIYTKASLIHELKHIRKRGWIPNARPGNSGGIGNTLEDLLEIPENNLPIPNANEWELKTQRLGSNALVTLFHMEPSPRALKFVPNILLPVYGWSHANAGNAYPQNERSFRQTINAQTYSDRGFTIKIDEQKQHIYLHFDPGKVDARHSQWLQNVLQRGGQIALDPAPYWGFQDLEHKAGAKLHNCFFVQAQSKRKGKTVYFKYEKISILEGFDIKGLLNGLREGFVYVDFDARTGHNHGTKFRVRASRIPALYAKVTEI